MKAGDFEKVKAFLKDHPDLVFSEDNHGATPLHLVFEGHNARVRREMAELLLVNKAKVNAKNKYGHTPLHEAAGFGDKDTAKLLLANKAEVDAKANDGRTPLHIAALTGNKGVAELLLAQQS